DPDGSGPARVELRESLGNEVGVSSADLGGVLHLGLETASGTAISLTNLYTHSGEATANRTVGFSVHDGQEIEATRLQFITREMNFTQLHGRHRLNAHGGELTWSGNVSLTARDEPDTRDLVYYPQEDGRSGYKNNSGS